LASVSLVTAMSTFPSPLKSPVATPDGNPPTGWLTAARKVPLALASRTLSVPEVRVWAEDVRFGSLALAAPEGPRGRHSRIAQDRRRDIPIGNGQNVRSALLPMREPAVRSRTAPTTTTARLVPTNISPGRSSRALSAES
jgi:hypothetical protein